MKKLLASIALALTLTTGAASYAKPATTASALTDTKNDVGYCEYVYIYWCSPVTGYCEYRYVWRCY